MKIQTNQPTFRNFFTSQGTAIKENIQFQSPFQLVKPRDVEILPETKVKPTPRPQPIKITAVKEPSKVIAQQQVVQWGSPQRSSFQSSIIRETRQSLVQTLGSQSEPKGTALTRARDLFISKTQKLGIEVSKPWELTRNQVKREPTVQATSHQSIKWILDLHKIETLLEKDLKTNPVDYSPLVRAGLNFLRPVYLQIDQTTPSQYHWLLTKLITRLALNGEITLVRKICTVPKVKNTLLRTGIVAGGLTALVVGLLGAIRKYKHSKTWR